MKKALTASFTILSLILILDSINAGHAIAMFILAGIIPGTNIAVSADRMLEVCVLLIGFILSRICFNLIYASYSSKGSLLGGKHFYFFDPNMGEYRISTKDSFDFTWNMFEAYQAAFQAIKYVATFEVDR